MVQIIIFFKNHAFWKQTLEFTNHHVYIFNGTKTDLTNWNVKVIPCSYNFWRKGQKPVQALKTIHVHWAGTQTMNPYTVPVLRGQHDCFKHCRLVAELQHSLFRNKYERWWYTACVWVCGLAPLVCFVLLFLRLHLFLSVSNTCKGKEEMIMPFSCLLITIGYIFHINYYSHLKFLLSAVFLYFFIILQKWCIYCSSNYTSIYEVVNWAPHPCQSENLKQIVCTYKLIYLFNLYIFLLIYFDILAWQRYLLF